MRPDWRRRRRRGSDGGRPWGGPWRLSSASKVRGRDRHIKAQVAPEGFLFCLPSPWAPPPLPASLPWLPEPLLPPL